MASPYLHEETHGEGEPLLLIAGLGQGRWVWRDVLPPLAQRRRVTAFDHHGTGRSTAPARSTVDDLARDAGSLLDGAADVLGFSMGGYAALTLTLARPELVRSLVLVGTGAGGPDRTPRPAWVREAFDSAIGLPPEEFGRRTLPYAFAPGWAESHPQRFEEILTARLEEPTPCETLAAHVEACYRFYELGVAVESIRVPTLVLHGAEDLIVPVENGRRLAERLASARYVELAGHGHDLMLEDPEWFAATVLGFLDGR